MKEAEILEKNGNRITYEMPSSRTRRKKDQMIFVKKLPQVAVLMADAECGYPYEGAKEEYLLNLGDDARIDALLPMLVEHTPLPRPRKKKSE